jgi:hypothetical protein
VLGIGGFDTGGKSLLAYDYRNIHLSVPNQESLGHKRILHLPLEERLNQTAPFAPKLY